MRTWMRLRVHWVAVITIVTLLIPLSGLCDDSIPGFISPPPSTSIQYSNRNGTSLHCKISESGALYEWFEVATPPDGGLSSSQLGSRMHGMIHHERRVHEIPGFRKVFQNGTLWLPPFRSYEYNPEIHSTTYQCKAKFGPLALISPRYTIQPVLQETIQLRVKDVYSHRGNSAFLRCEIPEHTQGYVKLISWLDGSGRRVGWNQQDQDKYSELSQGGHLVVHQISSFDEYTKFMCVAQNILTDSEIMYDRTGLVYPTSNYTKIHLRTGQNVSIGCIGQGIPVPQTIWYRSIEGDQLYPVTTNANTRVRHEILELYDVQTSHSASYICQVTNTNFQQTARFDIEVSPEYKLSLSPALERTRKGSNVTLTCASNREAPVNSSQLAWYRNGQPLEFNSNRHIVETSSLNILGVGEEDGGIYQCFHTEDQTVYSAIARIIIQDSVPEIVSSFAGDTYIPGQYLSLKCVARGRPPPRFKWLLDGYDIKTDARYRQSQYVTALENVESQLNLTHLTDKDGGHYSCIAMNTAGTVKHTQHIRVFGPPYIREVGPVSGVEGGWLQVDCPVSGYPIQAITWKKDPWNIWHTWIKDSNTRTNFYLLNFQDGQIQSGYSKG